jgi:HD-like signal output (HDOD) protein
LLHNFGFLVLGYLFPSELTALNNAISEAPDIPVIEHEQRLLGTNHAEVGGWLMQAWNMPEEVHVTISQHHNPDYDGPHVEYIRLITIANHLLKRYDIGDATSDELPAGLLEKAGITDTQALAILEKTLKGREELDSMARQLAA